MKRLTPFVVAVLAVGACQKGDQNAAGDTARVAADTNVTTREVQDTTIVTHDTTVRTDTVVKRGGVVPDSAARRP
jgi:hypothetical protein